jgi:hypothetical protein
MAFNLQKPPRVPVTLIGGGAWAVHHAGKTFGQIKNDPKQIADAFIRFFRLFQNDLIWTGSNLLNYPVHFLGCPIKDDSADSPALGGTVIQSLDEIDRLSIEKVLQNPTLQAIIQSHHRVADAIGKETMIVPTQWALHPHGTDSGHGASVDRHHSEPGKPPRLIQLPPNSLGHSGART